MIAAIFGGALVAAVCGLKRREPAAMLAFKGILLLVGLGAIEFGVCGFADAHAGIERHLFLFDAIMNVLLVLELAGGWVALSALRSRRAERES